MAPFVLHSLRGKCRNCKHPSNGIQVPLFTTDRNQLEPFITHARRGRILSLKEDFFIGSRVRDDKELKFP